MRDAACGRDGKESGCHDGNIENVWGSGGYKQYVFEPTKNGAFINPSVQGNLCGIKALQWIILVATGQKLSSQHIVKSAGLNEEILKPGSGFPVLKSEDLRKFLKSFGERNFCIDEYHSKDPSPRRMGEAVTCLHVAKHYCSSHGSECEHFGLVYSDADYHWWPFKAKEEEKVGGYDARDIERSPKRANSVVWRVHLTDVRGHEKDSPICTEGQPCLPDALRMILEEVKSTEEEWTGNPEAIVNTPDYDYAFSIETVAKIITKSPRMKGISLAIHVYEVTVRHDRFNEYDIKEMLTKTGEPLRFYTEDHGERQHTYCLLKEHTMVHDHWMMFRGLPEEEIISD